MQTLAKKSIIRISTSAAAVLTALAAVIPAQAQSLPSLMAFQPGTLIAFQPGTTPLVTKIRTQGPIVGISEGEVLGAQKAWCNALVSISTTADEKGQPAAKELAEKVIDGAYGYQLGQVLFKPTLTVVPQTFRTTKKGALAYFVGGDPEYPGDKGFALKGWRQCEIQNAGIYIIDNTATTMGNVVITDKNGKVVTVDKTWEYYKGPDGKLRIILHHSSLPYKPAS